MPRVLGAWAPIVNYVLARPAHAEVRYRKDSLPPPLKAGFRLSGGLPKMQLFDYRLALPDGKGIHVREYAEHYAVHWDMVDPSVSLLGHMIADAPKTLAVLVAAGSVAAGIYAARKGASLNA